MAIPVVHGVPVKRSNVLENVPVLINLVIVSVQNSMILYVEEMERPMAIPARQGVLVKRSNVQEDAPV